MIRSKIVQQNILQCIGNYINNFILRYIREMKSLNQYWCCHKAEQIKKINECLHDQYISFVFFFAYFIRLGFKQQCEKTKTNTGKLNYYVSVSLYFCISKKL